MRIFVVPYLMLVSILTVGILAPYSLRMTNSLPNSIDPLLYAWNLSHNLDSARNGFTSLLDTNIFYPETNTLALSDTLFAQTILTAPLLYFTSNPVLVENIYVLSTFPLSAATMFMLSYYLTGHAWASAISGIFFAFSYPRISQIGHMPAISSQWLPLFFLYFIRFIREHKFIHLVWTFVWYLASITSTIYFGIFLIPLAMLVYLIEIAGMPLSTIRKHVRAFLLISVPALIVLAIVLFPYIRLRVEFPGIKRSLEDSAKLSAMPVDYVSVLPTSWLADLRFPTNVNERPLYPTLTLMVLALSAVFIRNRKIIAFGSMASLAFILSLGPYMGGLKLPYYYLYKIFPLFQSVRVPARWSIFVILGLSVCAAFTLSKFLKSGQRILGILVVLFFLTEVWQVDTPYVTVPINKNLPSVYKFMSNAPKGAIIIELPLHPEWSGKRLEDQLMLAYDELTENDVYAAEAYRTYFSAFHKKRIINGYSGYFPNVYHDQSILVDKFPTTEGIELLEKRRVRYILIHAKQYVNVPFSDIERKIHKFGKLKLAAQFGTDYVYEIR